jgi:hypothetical protein
MHTDHQSDPLVELGYEQKDIHPKNIFKVSMIFFVFAFLSYGLGWVFLNQYGYFKDSRGVNDLMSTKIPKAPNPILQTNVTAKTDIKNMRSRERDVLTSGGKSEFVSGAERISIEQAIKLSAERGAKLRSPGGTP